MPRDLAPCGTRAAYRRHRRAGETPCEPCRLAAAEHNAAMRAKRSEREAETVRQVLAYGRADDVEVPTHEDPLQSARWRLARVRAAMLVAGPRDVAALAKAEADTVECIGVLTREDHQPVSALDQLAQRRAARMAGEAGA